MHLFRKMNYLQASGAQIRQKIDPSRAKTSDLDEIERLQEEALAVKNQIIRSNLRLVVRSPSGTSGPRTTSSSWYPMATCR